MRNHPPLTTAEHITTAKSALAAGGSSDYAIAHTLVAIAELLQANIAEAFVEGAKVGAGAAADAIGQVMNITGGLASDAHVCNYDDVAQCGWPGHRND